MSPLAFLTSGDFWFALTGYSAAVLTVESIAARARHSSDPDDDWFAEQIALPLGRALALILFVLLAYPALFGLAEAPPLGELLSQAGRTNRLINLSLLLTLLLPLLPVVGRPAVALPAQGIALSALLFHWLAADLEAQVRLWPGTETLAMVLTAAVAAPWLAGPPSRVLGDWLDRRFEREGFSVPAYEGLLLLFQLPAVLVYGQSLGAQLSG